MILNISFQSRSKINLGISQDQGFAPWNVFKYSSKRLSIVCKDDALSWLHVAKLQSHNQLVVKLQSHNHILVHVLFNTELSPKLIDNNTTSIFGLEINLNALDNRIKTVEEYNQEIELFRCWL
jgi:hypothetical protein